MSSHLRHVWLKEPVKDSPAVKFIHLAYEKIERILLSFTIDLSRSNNSYLDPTRPIKINGTTVQIPELQRDTYSLNFVERKEIDVTNLLKYSSEGEDNTIEVFFKSSQKFWSKKEVGILNLILTIYFPKEAPKQQKQESISIKFMFCIFCRREIPDYSKFCCHCGAKQEGGGREVKTCTVDNESLPQNAR
ncbi:MAG TPA: zinc ribbon domain-containing protein, partial [Nitrososphaeraceae archaeon]|nr:zinc ribbon domain-containing protein [Nitrososphaeraceae archaeon]